MAFRQVSRESHDGHSAELVPQMQSRYLMPRRAHVDRLADDLLRPSGNKTLGLGRLQTYGWELVADPLGTRKNLSIGQIDATWKASRHLGYLLRPSFRQELSLGLYMIAVSVDTMLENTLAGRKMSTATGI